MCKDVPSSTALPMLLHMRAQAMIRENTRAPSLPLCLGRCTHRHAFYVEHAVEAVFPAANRSSVGGPDGCALADHDVVLLLSPTLAVGVHAAVDELPDRRTLTQLDRCTSSFGALGRCLVCSCQRGLQAA